MRSDILKRIQELLLNEDLEAIRKDARIAIQSFRALTQDEIRAQREAWEKEDANNDNAIGSLIARREKKTSNDSI